MKYFIAITNRVRNFCITYYLLYWLEQNLYFIIGFWVISNFDFFVPFVLFASDRKIEKVGELKTQRRFMAKGKDVRVRVILECTSCVRNGVKKESTGISRYITQKNRHNTPSRLELRKFCPYCYKHTIHGEIKK